MLPNLVIDLFGVNLLVPVKNQILVLHVADAYRPVQLMLGFELKLFLFLLFKPQRCHFSLNPLFSHPVESPLSIKLFLFAYGLMQIFGHLLALKHKVVFRFVHTLFVHAIQVVLLLLALSVLAPLLVLVLPHPRQDLLFLVLYL